MSDELSLNAIASQVPPRSWKYQIVTLPNGKHRNFRRGYTKEEQLAAFHSAYATCSTGYATPCWVWIGLLKDQYGYFVYEGKHQAAHRVSWQIFNGPIPAGLFVCHKCDFRPCVNPEHLFLGTNGDNQRDAVAKGRKRFRRGEKHHRARLQDEQVRTIRAMLKAADTTQAEIARRFGVSKYTINTIASARGWKHIIDDGSQTVDKEAIGQRKESYEFEFDRLLSAL